MKIIAMNFYAIASTRINALKALEWCDVFFLPPNKLIGGIPGSIDELKQLGIDFKNYDAALIFHDGLSRTQEYFHRQCIKHGMAIYANQHGFNKSILQIVDFTPNTYSKYWNALGKYWLDRFKQVMKSEPISSRWISIGSLTHDYLYKNFRWDKQKTNGKVLLIHEPDTAQCEGDKLPHRPDEFSEFIINHLRKLNVEFDMKVHPNWANFIGNTGIKLWKPDNVNFVNIGIENIRNYSLVLGMRSSVLLDAAAMNVPTLALKMDSPAADDHFGPTEVGLIPMCEKESFDKSLSEYRGKTPSYDTEKLEYFVGPLGRISEDYYNFIREDLANSLKRLGKHYYNWQSQLNRVKIGGRFLRRVERKLKKIF